MIQGKNKPVIHIQSHKSHYNKWIRTILLSITLFSLLVSIFMIIFEQKYNKKIYPNVLIGGIPFGNKTKEEAAEYWTQRNNPFTTAQFELHFEGNVATISGSEIELGYDADLSAVQAFLIGRSNGFLTNLYQKFFVGQINLDPYFRWKQLVVDETIQLLVNHIDIPVEDALFQFENGKVTQFKPSKNGRRVNVEATNALLRAAFQRVANTNQQRLAIMLPVETIQPTVSTNNANSYGVKELIGKGYSEFAGSIPGRIHNVALAAARINGILIKPGEVFSFNEAIGDISAATGYQSAYIIKDGRTVLGDGGGVCQVSSTLFRAAMDAGLPIVERHAHAYRVHYYEEGGFPPGLDATVFSPSVDLKFTNDTSAYILIQAKPDITNLALTFEFYGTKDGRKSQVFNHTLSGQIAPPPPLYQDDPTLNKGVVKQVDWAAWGAKASFQYKVTRNDEVLQDVTFNSNFRPWQAVYLNGTL